MESQKYCYSILLYQFYATKIRIKLIDQKIDF